MAKIAFTTGRVFGSKRLAGKAQAFFVGRDCAGFGA